MMEHSNPELLGHLFAEIERAWRDRGDRALVYRLSREHPNLRHDLHEFFEDLVLGPRAEVDRYVLDAETRVHSWLVSTGFDLALAAAVQARSHETTTHKSTKYEHDSSPGTADEETLQNEGEGDTNETWIAFLRRRIGKRLQELTAELPNTNAEYLVLISRHPNLVPDRVKTELARRIKDRWGVTEQETLQPLESRRRFLRAASRARSFDKDPSSFNDLLEQSALAPDQKEFWLRLARTVD
jgi:hypothetical protein